MTHRTNTNNPIDFPKANKFDDLLYESGLTAQGCWDELDDYAKEAIQRYGELIVKECVRVAHTTEPDDDGDYKSGRTWAGMDILKHFGVE